MNYWNPKLLEQLLDVQKIDLEIRNIKFKVNELYRKSKEEDPEIIRLKNELAICEETVVTTEAQRQMYLDTLEDIHTAIKGLATTKSGAFKPRTRSSTEALRIEEEKLTALHEETIEQVKQLESQRLDLQERIQFRSKQVEIAQQGPEAEIRKLKAKLKKCDKQREEAAQGIPAMLMRKYDRLRQSRSGIGLTVMRDGVCTVCRMQMPTAVVSRLLNGGRVPVCPACGRMVTKVEYTVEPTQNFTSAANDKKADAAEKKSEKAGRKKKTTKKTAARSARKKATKVGLQSLEPQGSAPPVEDGPNTLDPNKSTEEESEKKKATKKAVKKTASKRKPKPTTAAPTDESGAEAPSELPPTPVADTEKSVEAETKPTENVEN